MTWWWETVRAAWRRWDAWRKRREDRWMYDRLSIWVTEDRMPGVEDTGVVTPTSLSLAAIAPAGERKPKPGHRHNEPRHAKPKGKPPVVIFSDEGET